MKELPRLIDDSSGDPELARLFRAGRPPAPIPPVAFRRSRKRVLGLAAAPAMLGVLALGKQVALGAMLGMATVAVVTLPRLATEAPRSATSVASRPRQAPARSPVAASSEPAPLPSAAIEPLVEAERLRVPEPSASAAEHVLLRETRLLERARAELVRRPALCLESLRQHAREFPNGALVLEREYLTVASLVRLGRRAEAEQRAQSLRARSPGSLYEERLERLLAGDP